MKKLFGLLLVLCTATGLASAPFWRCCAHAATGSIPAGRYTGTYLCGQGPTQVTIDIGPDASGTFSFEAPRASGSYLISIVPNGDAFDLSPVRWISRPPGYQLALARVQLNGDRLDGRVLAGGCGDIHAAIGGLGAGTNDSQQPDSRTLAAPPKVTPETTAGAATAAVVTRSSPTPDPIHDYVSRMYTPATQAKIDACMSLPQKAGENKFLYGGRQSACLANIDQQKLEVKYPDVEKCRRNIVSSCVAAGNQVFASLSPRLNPLPSPEEKLGIEMYERGCDLKNAKSCRDLASEYESGERIMASLGDADTYWSDACKLGDAMSCESARAVEKRLHDAAVSRCRKDDAVYNSTHAYSRDSICGLEP